MTEILLLDANDVDILCDSSSIVHLIVLFQITALPNIDSPNEYDIILTKLHNFNTNGLRP